MKAPDTRVSGANRSGLWLSETESTALLAIEGFERGDDEPEQASDEEGDSLGFEEVPEDDRMQPDASTDTWMVLHEY